MAIAWLLIVLGLSAPILTTYFAEAHRGAAGYASGAGYLVSILAIVCVVVLGRTMERGRRVRAYLIAGVLVVAANLWSSFNIVQGARIDREIVAARPKINAILRAAAAEAAQINAGRTPPGEFSPQWKPYATVGAPIELDDATVPMDMRLVELTRRAKARELDLLQTLRLELEASRIGDALSSDQLISSNGRADSLAGIERYRAFVQSFKERLGKLYELAEADMRSVGLPRASEDQLIGGLVRSQRANSNAYEQFVELELKTIGSMEAAIRFVDANAEAATAEDGQLHFSDPAMQADYEAMISRVVAVPNAATDQP